MRLLYFVAMQTKGRRLSFEICRFRVLLYLSLSTVFITFICFFVEQSTDTWKFQDNFMSAIQFGKFGIWGTYVFAVLILYSPDGKSNTSGNANFSEIQEDSCSIH
uniref:Wntless-like transmembrane domain-containing protein n=1 Tax=Clytia hemisphaerica TaxID=252671 RepID=A0A7M5UKS2_9CNID